MDESHEYSAEWKKPNTQKYVLYSYIYKKFKLWQL